MVIQLDELRMVIATRTSQKTATATIFNLRTSTRNSHFFLHVSSYSNPQKDAELREIEVKLRGAPWAKQLLAALLWRECCCQRAERWSFPWTMARSLENPQFHGWICSDQRGSSKDFHRMQHGLIVMVNTDLICHLNDLVNHNRRLMENY